MGSKRERTLKDDNRRCFDELEQIKSRLITDRVVIPEGEYMGGVLKHYYPQKGIGFIGADDGREYFLHNNRVAEGHQVKRHTRVRFRPVKRESKYFAYDVRVVKD